MGGLDSPGVGVLQAVVAAPTHWLAQGLPHRFEVVHYNGPCFTPLLHTDVTAVTHVQGAGLAFTPWERSLPGDAAPLVETLIADGAANVVTGPFGQGNVVLFGSHPEFGFDVLQLGWGVAARLFGNALRHQGTRRRDSVQQRDMSRVTLEVCPVADDLQRASQRFTNLADRAPDLTGAPAFQGQQAPAIWKAALMEASALSADTAVFLRGLNIGKVCRLSARPGFDSSSTPAQDYGFVGLESAGHPHS